MFTYLFMSLVFENYLLDTLYTAGSELGFGNTWSAR